MKKQTCAAAENTDLIVEISLQPWKSFRPDGIILFRCAGSLGRGGRRMWVGCHKLLRRQCSARANPWPPPPPPPPPPPSPCHCSDILTPLPAFGIPFEIDDDKGPLLAAPIRSEVGWPAARAGAGKTPARLCCLGTRCAARACSPTCPPAALPLPPTCALLRPQEGLKALHAIDLDQLSFVGESLGLLKQEAAGQAAVLGFVGCPWTLATYVVEGASSSLYKNIKTMMFTGGWWVGGGGGWGCWWVEDAWVFVGGGEQT